MVLEVKLTSKPKSAIELSGRIQSAVLSQRSGQVADLAITWNADDKAQASSLILKGDLITLEDRIYQVGRRERTYLPGGGVDVLLHCRSKLAKGMRTEFVVRSTKKVSPTDWVIAAVRDAGGEVIAQASTTVEAISQRGGAERTSTLKVIADLASKLGWEWSEANGIVTFASGFAILTEQVPGIKIARFTLAGNEDFTSWDSDDSNEAAAGATLTLPPGTRLDPLQLVKLTGADDDSGNWLVSSVTTNLKEEVGVKVELTQPRRPVAKRRPERKKSSSSAKSTPEWG